MADPINLTTADLMAEIGRLTMEVKARAAREDQLLAYIKGLQNPVEQEERPQPVPNRAARRRAT
jgi:hypothetical protein